MSTENRPPVNRRKHARQRPVNPKLLVEIHYGITIKATVIDESIAGGLGLLFETNPDLTVGSIITVWFRQRPTRGEVKYVLEQSGCYRVGDQWCGEKRRKPRPFGSK